MAGNIIPQNTKIEPVKVEAYRCPVKGCGEVLVDTYEEAVAHVNQPVALRFPIGFTFNVGGYYSVIRMDDNRLTFSHSPIYSVWLVCPESMQNRVMSSGKTDSLSILADIEQNSLLTTEQLEKFKSFHADFVEKHNLTLVRTTLELEQILAERKK